MTCSYLNLIQAKNTDVIDLLKFQTKKIRGIYTGLVATDSYALGGVGLYYSWKALESKYPFILIVTDNVSIQTREMLLNEGMTILVVPCKTFTGVTSNTDRYRYTINKLYAHMFSENFERICYVDASGMFMKTCDDLIDENGNYFWGFINPRYNKVTASGSARVVDAKEWVYKNFLNGEYDNFQTDEQVWQIVYPNEIIPLHKDSEFRERVAIKSGFCKYWFWEKYDSVEKIRNAFSKNKWSIIGDEIIPVLPPNCQPLLEKMGDRIGEMNEYNPTLLSLSLTSLDDI